MLRARVIPCLLLQGAGLVKTVKFRNPTYLGDPRNAVKIFNEKEVDELVLLDIGATAGASAPRLELIREIVEEAFMPVAYGGGIRTLDHIRSIIALGVEKVVLGTCAVENPALVGAAAALVGRSSVVVSVDVRRTWTGRYEVHYSNGRKNARLDPLDFAVRMEREGAGELMVNAIDRDGTMGGYDLALLRAVAARVEIPVIACGGAGSVADLGRVIREAGVAAAAAGSMFVYQGRHRAVLINYPEPHQLEQAIGLRRG